VYTVFAHATQSHTWTTAASEHLMLHFLIMSDGSVIFVPLCFLAAQETMKYTLILK